MVTVQLMVATQQRRYLTQEPITDIHYAYMTFRQSYNCTLVLTMFVSFSQLEATPVYEQTTCVCEFAVVGTFH